MTSPNPTKPTDEQLVAFAVGDLPAAQRKTVEAYVKNNKEAAAMIDNLRSVVQTLRSDDSVPPPNEIIKRAQALFHTRAFAAADRPGVLATWIAAVDRLVARLTYDSRVQPAAVRFADPGDRLNLTFETDSGEVDLQAERLPAEWMAREGEPSRWRVMGQISEGQSAQRELALLAVGSKSPVAIATSDQHGVFAMEAPRGDYELLIRAGDLAIVLAPINLT